MEQIKSDENQNPPSEGPQGEASISEVREVGEQSAKDQAGDVELSREGEGSSEAQPPAVLMIVGNDIDELRARLSSLIAMRDRAKEPELFDGEPNEEFNEWRDCDVILSIGTIVDVGGVPCRILNHVPAMSETFKDEAVLAEHLSRTPGNLAVNADALRQRYNGNGRAVGINERHGWNRLNAEIAELEAQIKAAEKAAAEAAPQQPAEAEAK